MVRLMVPATGNPRYDESLRDRVDAGRLDRSGEDDDEVREGRWSQPRAKDFHQGKQCANRVVAIVSS